MFTLAWREISRRKTRSMLTILSIFISVTLLISVWGILRSLREGISSVFQKANAHMVVQLFSEPGPYKRARLARHLGPIPYDVVKQIRELNGVGNVAGQLHFWVWMPQVKAMTAAAGIDPEVAREIGPLSSDIFVVKGRLLEPGDKGVAVVDIRYSDKWHVNVGDDLELCGRHFKVIGIIQPKALRAAQAEVFIPLTEAWEIMREEQPSIVPSKRLVVNEILIRVADLTLLTRLEKQIQSIIANALNLPPKRIKVFTTAKILPQASGISILAQRAAKGVAVIVLIAAMLLVMRTALSSVAERIAEIGVLRAVGWRNRDVSKLLTTEFAMQSVIGGALGCIIGELIIYGWSRATHGELPHAMNPFPCLPAIPAPTKISVPFSASLDLVLFAFFIAIVMGILSGWLAARRAAQLEPIDALRRV